MFTQKFTVATASGASTSSGLDTGGRSYSKLAVHYVTMSTGAEVTVWGSNGDKQTSGTFYQIAVQEVNTASSAFNTLTIGTAASGSWAVLDVSLPHRYLQFTTSAVVSGGVSFTVMCN